MITKEDIENIRIFFDKIIIESLERWSRERGSSTERQPDPDRVVKKYLSLEEAGKYLGVAKGTMYKFTHKREIPYYKPNRAVYFKIEDLDSWISKNRVSSQEEIEREAQKYLDKMRK
jgi:excisionase family DNA binding protein